MGRAWDRAILALFAVAIHLGCGAWLYAYHVGALVDFHSATFWGWLLAWPMALLFTYWKVAAWFVGVVVGLLVAAVVFSIIANRRA